MSETKHIYSNSAMILEWQKRFPDHSNTST